MIEKCRPFFHHEDSIFDEKKDHFRNQRVKLHKGKNILTRKKICCNFALRAPYLNNFEQEKK